MPTMRVGAPSIGTTRPMTDSSPPNAVRQSSLERTATSSAPGSGVLARELPASDRRDSKRRHQLGCDDGGVDSAWLVRRAEVHRAGPVAPDSLKRSVALRKLHELRRRDPELVEAQTRKLAGNVDEALRRRVWQRLEDDTVDYAEDSSVGANSKSKGQYRDRGITGALSKTAKGVDEIVAHSLTLS